MDKRIELLYNLYVDQHLINPENVPLDVFAGAQGDQLVSLYELGVQNRLFQDVDQNTFIELFQKKKDGSTSVLEEDTMDSDSGTTPSESIVMAETDPLVTVGETQDNSTSVFEQYEDFSSSSEEKTAFENLFGKNIVTDLVGDMFRAWYQGQAQGSSIDDALSIWAQGSLGMDLSNEEIQTYIDAINDMNAQGPSDEMRQFLEIYEKSGNSWGGLFMGIAANPSILPQLLVSSVSAMINPTVIAGGATGAGTAAVGAVAVGNLTALVGVPEEIVTVPTALLGGAIFGATTTLETGLTFTELLLEELGDKPMNVDNMREVLENPDTFTSIRNKALARGITIGTIEAVLGAFVTKAVSGTATGLYRTTKLGKKLSNVAGAGVGIVGEGVVGSLGEYTAREVIGQEQDKVEVVLEGIVGPGTTGPLTIGAGLIEANKEISSILKPPAYKVNDGIVTREVLLDIINTSTPAELAEIKIEIKNDPTLLEEISNIKQTNKIKNTIKTEIEKSGIVAPGKIDMLVDLEYEKSQLKENNTEAGKRRKQELDNLIQTILDGGAVEIVETQINNADGTTDTSKSTISVGRDFAIEELKKEGVNNPTSDQVDQKVEELFNKAKEQITGETINVSETSPESSTESINASISESPISNEIPRVNEQIENAGFNIEESNVTVNTITTNSDGSRSADITIENNNGETVGDMKVELDNTVSVENKPDSESVVEDIKQPDKKETPLTEQKKETPLTEEQKEVAEFFGLKPDENTQVDVVEENIVVNKDKRTQQAPDTKTTAQLDISSLINIGKAGVQAIKAMLPDVKLVIHENTQTFNKNATPDAVAEYDVNTKTIHVNAEKAGATTIPHELFHAVLIDKVGTETAAITANMIDAVNKTLGKNSKLKQQLEAFAENYDPSVQNEEQLAELTGVLAANFKKLSKPEKNIVLKWIKEIGQKLGFKMDFIKQLTRDEEAVIDLLNTLAKKFTTGETITESDVSILEGEQNVSPQDRASRQQKIGKLIREGLATLGEILGMSKPEATEVSKGAEIKVDKPPVPDTKSVVEETVQEKVEEKPTPQTTFYTKQKRGREAFDIEITESEKKLPVGTSYTRGEFGVDQAGMPSQEGAVWFSTEPSGDSYAGFKFTVELDIKNPYYRKEGNKRWSYSEMKKLQDMGHDAIVVYGRGYTGELNPLTWNVADEIIAIDKSVIKDVKDGQKKLQQLKMEFDTAELKEDFNADDFYKQKQKELGDNYKAALATKKEVDRREALKAKQKPAPKKAPYKKTPLKEVIKRFKMDDKGFIPAANILSRVKEVVAPLGLSAKRAESGSRDIYLTKGGVKINPAAKRQQLETPEGRQRMPEQEMSLEDYVTKGRDAGFTDARIKDFLVNVSRKFGAREVNAALKTSIPKSFANMKGGVKAGKKLLGKVKTYYDTLVEANSKRKTPKPDAVLVDKTIEYIETLEGFKKEADTYKRGGRTVSKRGYSKQQASMLSEVQSFLEGTPTATMAAKLRTLKSIVSSMERGQKNLQQIKRDVKNYLRRYLPKGLYTKSEALKLVREVEKATKENLENVLSKVDDLVVKKNVSILSSNIKNILTDKYTKTVGGIKKGVKISNEARKKIARIKKYAGNYTKMSAQELVDKKQELLNDFNELSQQSEAKNIGEQLMEIQTAINLVEASLLADTNLSKAQTLADVNATLEELVTLGKTELAAQLEADHQKYLKEMVEAYQDITGEKIDPKSKDFKTKIKAILDKLKTAEDLKSQQEGRLKKWVNSFGKKIQQYLNRAEALDGVMDLLSKLPGEMFGGKLQTLVTDKVDAASIEFKKRRMEMEKVFINKLKQLYGKKWAKVARQHRKVMSTGILTNKNIQNAQKLVKDNPTPENKQILLDAVKNQPALNLSLNQMYYLYNQFKDTKNHPSFEETFGPEYKRVMEEMTAFIKKTDPKLLEFADWQVNELFPTLYEHYNKVYKSIYRTDMPWNQNYAGRIYKEGTNTEPMNLLGKGGMFIGSNEVTGNSTHIRTSNPAKLKIMDGSDALFTYLNDMEYFAAYAETIKDINKLFNNKDIRDAVRILHGDDVLSLIETSIERVANRGSQSPKMAAIVNQMNNVFIVSRLALSPVIAMKQLTSTVTYANDIGIRNWIKYQIKNIADVKKTWAEIRDNSVYMQDRKYNSILQTIESYSETGMESFVPGEMKQWYLDFLMYTTKWGDRTAIMLGGMPNYKFYKDQYKKANPKATEQEVIDYAIKKFEKDTKRTQQSGDIQDKDYYQTGNPFFRAMNMFMTTPKQYLRKEIQSIRQLYRKFKGQDSKGTMWENMRTFAVYHFVMPTLFQYVAMGLPGMLRGWRDDDIEDLLRAAALGNLNAFFLAGELITWLADKAQGKPWAKDFSPKTIGVYETVQRINSAYNKWEQANTQLLKYKNDQKKWDKLNAQQEKVDKLWMRFLAELTTVGPSGAPAVLKWWENLGKLNDPDSDIGKDIMRILNYGDYQIEGKPEKVKPKKKIPLRDLKILDRRAYDEIMLEKEQEKLDPDYIRDKQERERDRREKELELLIDAM